MQNALWGDLPLHRGPVGEYGRGSFAGTFEEIKIEVYEGSFFGSGGYQDSSLEAIWNFGKGTELS